MLVEDVFIVNLVGCLSFFRFGGFFGLESNRVRCRGIMYVNV